MNNIIILNQVADTITLYINCYKNGYTTLCYFFDPEQVMRISLEGPRITIKGLEEQEYYFYCENQEQEETGHISVSVFSALYDTFWNNLITYASIQKNIEILTKIKDPDYIMALYKLAVQDNISEYEESLLSCISFFNQRQESLNTSGTPEFIFTDDMLQSANGRRYQFVMYQFHKTKQTWELVPGQNKEKRDTCQIYGKPSEMYRILVLSDFSVVREYFYYQPSETLSETILEGKISAKQQLTEKTAEMMARFDMTDLLDDEYGQEIVCSLQEVTPNHIILPIPQIAYEKSNALFYVKFTDPSLLPVANYSIYLAALEIDQAFIRQKAPHKILVTGETFIFNPRLYNLHYGEDYIFYFCDEQDNILSAPSLCGYDTDTDTDLYFSVSRRNDVEQYRRRLFTVFKEYNKSEWNTVSEILDRYGSYVENLYMSITDYMLENISRLDIWKHRAEFLMQLVLLTQLKHDLPVDQTFIKNQIYAEGYHKHIFPESQNPYIIRRGRINKNTLSWDYFSCGDTVKEIRTDQDSFLLLQAVDKQLSKTSPYAFYHNIYTGNTRYFYYPDLEVTVTHGLY